MNKNVNKAILRGKVRQSDKEYFTLRFNITAGKLTLDELDAIKELAVRFGRDEVHLTTRQGLEISWLKVEDQQAISAYVKEKKLKTGSTGPRLRNVNACPGNTLCRFGLINSPELATLIDKTFGERELPSKMKVAVSGCPNSCAKPQINDLGILGVVYPGFIRKSCTACGACVRICKVKALELVNSKIKFIRRNCVYCGSCVRTCNYGAVITKKQGLDLYVGGKVGRKPLIGHKLVTFYNQEQIIDLIDRLLLFYSEHAEKGERLGQFIKKIGYHNFKSGNFSF